MLHGYLPRWSLARLQRSPRFRLFDHRREVGRPRQLQRRRDLIVAFQHFLEAVAPAALREWERAIAFRGQVTKPERGDDVVVVKGLQHAADHGNHALQALNIPGLSTSSSVKAPLLTTSTWYGFMKTPQVSISCRHLPPKLFSPVH
jgi:hypothetical protein